MPSTIAALQADQTRLARDKRPEGDAYPEVDELGNAVLSNFDPTVQDELITKIHEAVVRGARNLMIVSDLNPRAMSPKVKGFVQAQSWFQDITQIYIADK